MTRPSPRDPSAAAAPDHWQILGLAPGADSAALKRAFRAQARRWHPDLNGNDPLAEERFKQVNEAYAVLSDPLRRRAWENGEPDGMDAEADPFASGFPRFQDYLAELEGREPAAAGPASGRQPSRPAAHDRRDQPEHHRRDDDGHDGYDGHDGRNDRPAEHGDSGGAGRSPRGWVEPSVPPPPPVRAAGDQESLVELTPTQALHGERVELELSDGTMVELITPPLAGDGWRLRLAAVAPGGGDHFLQLRVRTASGLRIDGLRVHYPLEITPAEAVLGCQVVVPTLEGPVKLRVPPGSSSGRLLRLRGRGQRLGERQGDQLVEVRITVEEPHGDDELALYRRLRQLEQQRRQPPQG
ncbi:MAG: DnaJ domain-containing protein [Synechococcus sp.]|nr:DnaJ domain-containing protein [Synechococcus sp.]